MNILKRRELAKDFYAISKDLIVQEEQNAWKQCIAYHVTTLRGPAVLQTFVKLLSAKANGASDEELKTIIDSCPRYVGDTEPVIHIMTEIYCPDGFNLIRKLYHTSKEEEKTLSR